MRNLLRCGIATLVGIGALLAANAPATAITGGVEDTRQHVFQRGDGRLLPARRSFSVLGHAHRATGVPHRRPLHVPGHRQGRRHVRPAHLPHRSGSRSRHPSRRRRRRTRRCGLGDRLHRGRHHFAGTRANRTGSSARRSPTPSTATSRTQELERHRRHHPRRGARAPDVTARSGELPQRLRASLVLNSTSFLTIGYGTEVRKAESGPQTPTPMRQPIVRRYTTEIGQKLTDQILQTERQRARPARRRRHLLRRLRRSGDARRLRRG